MDFKEEPGHWMPMPRWADFLVQFGYLWPQKELETRRICLISMPCESPGAALVTLGSLIRDLCNPDANEIENYYQFLKRYSFQYLDYCRCCDLDRCDPSISGCGFKSRASGSVKSVRGPQSGYKVGETADNGERQITFDRRGVANWLLPQNAVRFYVEGSSPCIVGTDDGTLQSEHYSDVIPEADIIPDNLKRSYSGLCIAGRPFGESGSKDAYSKIRFKGETFECGLDELLTINTWSNSKISRVAYFNTRIKKHAIQCNKPALVIADGDKAFLQCLNLDEFQQSDIIGITSQVIDHERLEMLGNTLQQLIHWYDHDLSLEEVLPSSPLGVTYSVLKTR